MINPNTFDLLSDLIYLESALGPYRQYVEVFSCGQRQFLGFLLFYRAKYCTINVFRITSTSSGITEENLRWLVL
jgi:hypothetical protein